MKTIQLTDKQIDILEDLLLWHLEEEETNNDSLSRDEEYINDLKIIYNTIVVNRFEVEEWKTSIKKITPPPPEMPRRFKY